MSHRITVRIEPLMDAALERHRGGDQVSWEMTLLPHPENQTPTIALFFWLAGPLLGNHIQGSAMLGNPVTVDDKEIDGIVEAMLGQMREARSQMLSQSNGQAPHGPSGLIVPRRG